MAVFYVYIFVILGHHLYAFHMWLAKKVRIIKAFMYKLFNHIGLSA